MGRAVRSLRGAAPGLPGSHAHRRGVAGGRGAPRRVRLLPPALPLRGEPAPLRAHELAGAHAAGSDGEARRAPRARRDRVGPDLSGPHAAGRCALRWAAGGTGPAPKVAGEVLRPIDVARRAEVVARHEVHGRGRAVLRPGSRSSPPVRGRADARARRRTTQRRGRPPAATPRARARPPPARDRDRRRGRRQRRPRPSPSASRPQRSDAPGPSCPVRDSARS